LDWFRAVFLRDLAKPDKQKESAKLSALLDSFACVLIPRS